MAAKNSRKKMSVDEYRDLGQKTVVKANELITHTEFSLSAQQQKIILFLISRIQPGDDDFTEYDFSANEFCRACGLDHVGGRQADLIKAALEDLADAKIRYRGSRWIPIGDGWETMLHWIEKPYFHPNSGTIRVRLDKDMKPFLLHLRTQFTKYELIWTLQLTGRYSIRLYELCCAYQFDKLRPYSRKIRLGELKKRLDAEVYKRWPDFRRRVLDPAVNEINDKTDRQIRYDTVTGPRGVVEELILHMELKENVDRLRLYARLEEEYSLNQLSLFDHLEDDKGTGWPPEAPGAPRIEQEPGEG